MTKTTSTKEGEQQKGKQNNHSKHMGLCHSREHQRDQEHIHRTLKKGLNFQFGKTSYEAQRLTYEFK